MAHIRAKSDATPKSAQITGLLEVPSWIGICAALSISGIASRVLRGLEGEPCGHSRLHLLGAVVAFPAAILY